MREEYLKISGLENSATKLEIKKAYRKLSKKDHPDLSTYPEATEKFIETDTAYDYLTGKDNFESPLKPLVLVTR